MKMIITDIDTGEEEIVRLPAPRQDQYLADEVVRSRREFVIDTVILEGLKFISNRDVSPRFIESPNSKRCLYHSDEVIDLFNPAPLEMQDIERPIPHPRVHPMCPCNNEPILPRPLATHRDQTPED